MVSVAPIVPDLHLWPPLIGGLVAATAVGVIAGAVDHLLGRHKGAPSRDQRVRAEPPARLEPRAA